MPLKAFRPWNEPARARAALNANFKTNLAHIQKAIAAAGVDGVNLLDGSVEGASNVSSATLTGRQPLWSADR